MSGPTRHSFELIRSDDDSDGSAIPAGKVPTTDGTHGWTYEDPAGSALTVQDEGTPLATDADTLNFVGAGVTASGAGATKTITIPGGATTLDGLTDVVITAAVNADRLRFNSASGVWEDSNLVWEPLIASDGSVMTDGLLNPMQAEVPY